MPCLTDFTQFCAGSFFRFRHKCNTDFFHDFQLQYAIFGNKVLTASAGTSFSYSEGTGRKRCFCHGLKTGKHKKPAVKYTVKHFSVYQAGFFMSSLMQSPAVLALLNDIGCSSSPFIIFCLTYDLISISWHRLF